MLILKYLLSYSIYFLFNGKQKYSLSNKNFSCKISRFHPIKQIKKLDVISLKIILPKHWYHYVIHLIVHLMVRFISDFFLIYYICLKII